MNKTPILQLRSISKDYIQGRSVVEVLDNINLSLYESETLSIIGESGSGKSTLLRIACLLDSFQNGEVIVNGKSFHDSKNAHEMRLKYMGFIYQDHYLLSEFTVQENVAIPLIIQGKKGVYEKAQKILETLGLGKRLYHVPGELSGGEKQRVAIARAFVTKPKIILADEPTGNLDPETASNVFDMFMESAKNFGTAIIMVSHNLALAKRMQHNYMLVDSALVKV